MRTTFAPLDSGLSIGLSIPLFEKLGLTIISLTHAIWYNNDERSSLSTKQFVNQSFAKTFKSLVIFVYLQVKFAQTKAE